MSKWPKAIVGAVLVGSLALVVGAVKPAKAPLVQAAMAQNSSADAAQVRRKLHLGREAREDEISGWDIDIRPDGKGLPVGRGTVKHGEELYLAQCAACHGEFGESAGRWPILSGGSGTLASHDPIKSVGSYWPHASTLLDYIRRSMPYGNAQSLNNDDLYAVTAFVLYLNDIIKDEDFELTDKNFASIKLPNEANFFDDDRESTERAFWTKQPCMENCAAGEAKIISRARALDVTPESGGAPKVE